METLRIVSRKDAPETVKLIDASHAVSLRDFSFEHPRLELPEQNWLRLSMFDRYFWPGDPERKHIEWVFEQIDAFGQALPGDARVVVNCQMGISRSTATGFILCARDPKTFEQDKEFYWSSLGRFCAPNQTLLEIADAHYGHGGKMIEFGEWIARNHIERGGMIPHRKEHDAPPNDPFDVKDAK